MRLRKKWADVRNIGTIKSAVPFQIDDDWLCC